MKIKGAKLHKKQLEIFNTIKNSNAKYFTINASRQSGKSYLLSEFVRYFSITEKKKEIMYVTPTYPLGDKFFTKILNSLEGIPVLKSINKSKLKFEFVNGTIVTFKSAERFDNIRGGSYDYVFIDEFSFFKLGSWEAIKPTIVAKKNAKVIIVSTPKGHNLFYDMCLLGQSDNKRYKYFFMHYSDNPMCDLEEVADAKKVLPNDIYKQEYEAEFIDDGGTVFKDVTSKQTITKWSLPEQNNKYFAGLDIGKKDFTVLTIFDKDANIVLIHSDKEKSYAKIIQNLIPILQKYNPLVYVETNGVGDVFFDMLLTKYSRLVSWTNTNSEKTEIIETLIADLDDNKILLPTKDLCFELDFEMKVFIYEYSPKTRRIKYFAQPPHHDDHVLSLAIAYKSYRENKFSGRYITKKRTNKYIY